MQLQVLDWPRSAKQLVVIGLDLVLSVLATWVAFSLRLDTLHIPDALQLRVYVMAPCLAIPVFIHFGLYRAVFRYTGQAALIATAKAVGVYALALSAVLVSVQWTMVPRSLGILQPLVFLILVATSRAMARFWLAGMGRSAENGAGRLLIFGAGTAGVQTAVALAVSRQFTLVGFVDDDPAKCGRSINGVPVWPASTVAERIAREGVTDILLAIPGATRERRKAVVDALKALAVHVRTLPSMQDLASGRVKVQDFRELDIEDLLGRDPVPRAPICWPRTSPGRWSWSPVQAAALEANCHAKFLPSVPEHWSCWTTASLRSTASTKICWRCARVRWPISRWCPFWHVLAIAPT